MTKSWFSFLLNLAKRLALGGLSGFEFYFSFINFIANHIRISQTVTLVAFLWLFSTVYFQMCPQIAWLRAYPDRFEFYFSFIFSIATSNMPWSHFRWSNLSRSCRLHIIPIIFIKYPTSADYWEHTFFQRFLDHTKTRFVFFLFILHFNISSIR